jgi:hypothetical protein
MKGPNQPFFAPSVSIVGLKIDQSDTPNMYSGFTESFHPYIMKKWNVQHIWVFFIFLHYAFAGTYVVDTTLYTVDVVSEPGEEISLVGTSDTWRVESNLDLVGNFGTITNLSSTLFNPITPYNVSLNGNAASLFVLGSFNQTIFGSFVADVLDASVSLGLPSQLLTFPSSVLLRGSNISIHSVTSASSLDLAGTFVNFMRQSISLEATSGDIFIRGPFGVDAAGFGSSITFTAAGVVQFFSTFDTQVGQSVTMQASSVIFLDAVGSIFPPNYIIITSNVLSVHQFTYGTFLFFGTTLKIGGIIQDENGGVWTNSQKTQFVHCYNGANLGQCAQLCSDMSNNGLLTVFNGSFSGPVVFTDLLVMIGSLDSVSTVSVNGSIQFDDSTVQFHMYDFGSDQIIVGEASTLGRLMVERIGNATEGPVQLISGPISGTLGHKIVPVSSNAAFLPEYTPTSLVLLGTYNKTQIAYDSAFALTLTFPSTASFSIVGTVSYQVYVSGTFFDTTDAINGDSTFVSATQLDAANCFFFMEGNIVLGTMSGNYEVGSPLSMNFSTGDLVFGNTSTFSDFVLQATNNVTFTSDFRAGSIIATGPFFLFNGTEQRIEASGNSTISFVGSVLHGTGNLTFTASRQPFYLAEANLLFNDVTSQGNLLFDSNGLIQFSGSISSATIKFVATAFVMHKALWIKNVTATTGIEFSGSYLHISGLISAPTIVGQYPFVICEEGADLDQVVGLLGASPTLYIGTGSYPGSPTFPAQSTIRMYSTASAIVVNIPGGFVLDDASSLVFNVFGTDCDLITGTGMTLAGQLLFGSNTPQDLPLQPFVPVSGSYVGVFSNSYIYQNGRHLISYPNVSAVVVDGGLWISQVISVWDDFTKTLTSTCEDGAEVDLGQADFNSINFSTFSVLLAEARNNVANFTDPGNLPDYIYISGRSVAIYPNTQNLTWIVNGSPVLFSIGQVFGSLPSLEQGYISYLTIDLSNNVSFEIPGTTWSVHVVLKMNNVSIGALSCLSLLVEASTSFFAETVDAILLTTEGPILVRGPIVMVDRGGASGFTMNAQNTTNGFIYFNDSVSSSSIPSQHVILKAGLGVGVDGDVDTTGNFKCIVSTEETLWDWGIHLGQVSANDIELTGSPVRFSGAIDKAASYQPTRNFAVFVTPATDVNLAATFVTEFGTIYLANGTYGSVTFPANSRYVYLGNPVDEIGPVTARFENLAFGSLPRITTEIWGASSSLLISDTPFALFATLLIEVRQPSTLEAYTFVQGVSSAAFTTPIVFVEEAWRPITIAVPDVGISMTAVPSVNVSFADGVLTFTSIEPATVTLEISIIYNFHFITNGFFVNSSYVPDWVYIVPDNLQTLEILNDAGALTQVRIQGPISFTSTTSIVWSSTGTLTLNCTNGTFAGVLDSSTNMVWHSPVSLSSPGDQPNVFLSVYSTSVIATGATENAFVETQGNVTLTNLTLGTSTTGLTKFTLQGNDAVFSAKNVDGLNGFQVVVQNRIVLGSIGVLNVPTNVMLQTTSQTGDIYITEPCFSANTWIMSTFALYLSSNITAQSFNGDTQRLHASTNNALDLRWISIVKSRIYLANGTYLVAGVDLTTNGAGLYIGYNTSWPSVVNLQGSLTLAGPNGVFYHVWGSVSDLLICTDDVTLSATVFTPVATVVDSNANFTMMTANNIFGLPGNEEVTIPNTGIYAYQTTASPGSLVAVYLPPNPFVVTWIDGALTIAGQSDQKIYLNDEVGDWKFTVTPLESVFVVVGSLPPSIVVTTTAITILQNSVIQNVTVSGNAHEFDMQGSPSSGRVPLLIANMTGSWVTVSQSFSAPDTAVRIVSAGVGFVLKADMICQSLFVDAQTFIHQSANVQTTGFLHFARKIDHGNPVALQISSTQGSVVCDGAIEGSLSVNGNTLYITSNTSIVLNGPVVARVITLFVAFENPIPVRSVQRFGVIELNNTIKGNSVEMYSKEIDIHSAIVTSQIILRASMINVWPTAGDLSFLSTNLFDGNILTFAHGVYSGSLNPAQSISVFLGDGLSAAHVTWLQAPSFAPGTRIIMRLYGQDSDVLAPISQWNLTDINLDVVKASGSPTLQDGFYLVQGNITGQFIQGGSVDVDGLGGQLPLTYEPLYVLLGAPAAQGDLVVQVTADVVFVNTPVGGALYPTDHDVVFAVNGTFSVPNCTALLATPNVTCSRDRRALTMVHPNNSHLVVTDAGATIGQMIRVGNGFYEHATRYDFNLSASKVQFVKRDGVEYDDIKMESAVVSIEGSRGVEFLFSVNIKNLTIHMDLSSITTESMTPILAHKAGMIVVQFADIDVRASSPQSIVLDSPVHGIMLNESQLTISAGTVVAHGGMVTSISNATATETAWSGIFAYKSQIVLGQCLESRISGYSGALINSTATFQGRAAGIYVFEGASNWKEMDRVFTGMHPS